MIKRNISWAANQHIMISEESCDTKTGLMAAENADFPVQIFHSITIFTVANGLFHSIIGLTVVEWERWNKKNPPKSFCGLQHTWVVLFHMPCCKPYGLQSVLIEEIQLLSSPSWGCSRPSSSVRLTSPVGQRFFLTT